MYFEVEEPGKLSFRPYPNVERFLNFGEILIERVGCGICRSDVGVFDGRESIPSGMFGHESYGVVKKSNSPFFREGDFVASFWHPGYADYFIAPDDKCISIPELAPKWAIVQPLACVINALDYLVGKTLVIGRGFTVELAKQIASIEKIDYMTFEEDHKDGTVYDTVLEMSGRGLPDINLFRDEARLVWFSTLQNPVTTNLFEWSWKALTVVFPSPRSFLMPDNMSNAVEYLSQFEPNITHLFKFEEAQKAFEIASTRSDNYLKGVFVK